MEKPDPIHQFQLQEIFSFGRIGNAQLNFTQSSLFMVGATVVIVALVLLATRGSAVVPGRVQSFVEMSYEFVADTVRSSAGEEGMRFFPFVFSLFMFVLLLNLVGLIPYSFTVTSHIVITFGLAAAVILTVVVYGFVKHGTRFLGLFIPSGVPAWLLPLMVAIEVISFLSRPISLSVRLFANMLAGHIALKIFAWFVAALLSAGFWAVISPLPLLLVVALYGLEFLVAVLQAYVFATLTAVYLNDALHPGH